jgi:small conductance mechanosensitive channel
MAEKKKQNQGPKTKEKAEAKTEKVEEKKVVKEPKEKKPLTDQQREDRAILIVLGILGIITLIAVIMDNDIFGPGAFGNNPTGNSVIDGMYHCIPAIIRTCEILFVALFLFVFLELIKRQIKAHTHFQTALRLVLSFTRYAVFIVAIVWILASWGVDTQTLLVSAGILGLIIGLGAQSLIADIIAGMFIVFDGQYRVGDFIVIDGWRGQVMEIGIRTTKIKDEGGNIKYVNNNEIKAVVNQSQDLSVIKCELCIFYDENLENVELKIKKYLPKIKDKIPYIVDGPYYKGVQGMEDSYVTLLFLGKCEEVDYYPAKRALNREIYRMAAEMNIPIPYPQIVLNQPMPEGSFAESTTTPKQKKEATAFVYNQAYDSEGMESENSN